MRDYLNTSSKVKVMADTKTPHDTDYPVFAYIEWFDAVAEGEWAEVTEAEAHPCTTLGFIVAENDRAICIASTVSWKDTNAKLHIPKGWIEKIWRVPAEDIKEFSKDNPLNKINDYGIGLTD